MRLKLNRDFSYKKLGDSSFSFLCRQLPSLAQDTHKQFPPQQVIRHRHHNYYHCGRHHHFDHQQDDQLNPDNFPHHQSNHASLKLDLDDNHSSEEELEDIIGTKKVSINFFIFSFFVLFAFLMIFSLNHVFAGRQSESRDQVLDNRDHQDPNDVLDFCDNMF